MNVCACDFTLPYRRVADFIAWLTGDGNDVSICSCVTALRSSDMRRCSPKWILFWIFNYENN